MTDAATPNKGNQIEGKLFKPIDTEASFRGLFQCKDVVQYTMLINERTIYEDI